MWIPPVNAKKKVFCDMQKVFAYVIQNKYRLALY